MTWSKSRYELTDPSSVTPRHSCRQLDIWLISGWHWAHLAHHGNSVRPCFGSVPRPGLCWAGHFASFPPSCPGWAACLPCCLSYFHQDSSPMLPCLAPAGLSTSRCLALSPSPPTFPLPCLPAKPAHRVNSPNQPASQPELQHSKVGNQTALSSPPQPITASSEAAHHRSALIQKASPTLDLLIGRITTLSGPLRLLTARYRRTVLCLACPGVSAACGGW